MAQAKTRMTAATGAFFQKSVCWALLSLCFSTAVWAETAQPKADPTLKELIEQGNKAARQYQNKLPINNDAARIQFKEVEGNPNQAAADRATTVVFISHSIPENELMRLLEQGAGRKDTLFVLRGFPNGDGKKSRAFIHKLAEKYAKAKKPMPNIMIYPQAFRSYNITRVPAVLHKNTDGKWYMAQGGLNIDNAVAALERHQYSTVLSRQWQVAEPDQAEYFRQQTMKIAAQNKDKWEEHSAQLVQKKIQGELTLPYAQKTATDTFTPYYTMQYDLIDPQSKKVLVPKGTKLNLLGNDTSSGESLLFIDGRDDWQVEFANEVQKKSPDTYIFYTQKGKLSDGIPLDKGIAERLQVSVVPTLLIKKGNQFERRIYKRK